MGWAWGEGAHVGAKTHPSVAVPLTAWCLSRAALRPKQQGGARHQEFLGEEGKGFLLATCSCQSSAQEMWKLPKVTWQSQSPKWEHFTRVCTCLHTRGLPTSQPWGVHTPGEVGQQSRPGSLPGGQRQRGRVLISTPGESPRLHSRLADAGTDIALMFPAASKPSPRFALGILSAQAVGGCLPGLGRADPFQP